MAVKDTSVAIPGRESSAGSASGIFSQIAPGYDLLNKIMSLGQDRSWRRFAASLATSSSNGLALDLATGTGEMAFELAPRARAVIAIDVCPQMLSQARRKATWKEFGSKTSFLLADVLATPFPDDSFDCATIGFATRHVGNIADAFAEWCRILKPGGRVVCLELVRPSSTIGTPFYRFYLYKLVPLIARCLNKDRRAYISLADSVLGFLTAGEIKRVMEEAGLSQVIYRLLNLGTVAIHSGVKPLVSEEAQ